MSSSKRGQQSRPKKAQQDVSFQRQQRRNQILFVALAAILIISMILSLVTF